ncbi:MAG TPA: hypothetical protein VJN88_04860 [Ktedonobacterales bacterium]|nr:hypothetical protein [Ktedonobacterales bacterium]
MVTPRRQPSLRWGSLVVMVIFFAIAIGALVAIPSSPVNRTHTTTSITPGAVTLPPTAPASTATAVQPTTTAHP